jgi:putative SOS response-associated peptidase YedK
VCGRFTLRTPAEQLAWLFSCDIPTDLAPTYNAAPTQAVAAVRSEAGSPQFARLRWGLIPAWAKDRSIGNRMINARAETVAEKPAFRAAFRARRCLILADGYFEWQKVGKAKQPYYIRRHDEAPFAMAGLWESWNDPQTAETVQSCTIITTEANQTTRPIHDRMPAIVSDRDRQTWLDPQQKTPSVLLPLLRPFDPASMVAYPVDRWVNNPRHQQFPLSGENGQNAWKTRC